MKKVLIYLFLICSTGNLLAQQKTKIIYRDTINLRGYVYNEQGKPIKYLYIESTQLDPEYNQFRAGAVTDTNGFFEIKGAKFYDTLKFGEGHATYYTPDFYNRDSRYVVIYLSPRVVDINSTDPVVVTHSRRYPKITPALNIKPYEPGDYFHIQRPAEYP